LIESDIYTDDRIYSAIMARQEFEKKMQHQINGLCAIYCRYSPHTSSEILSDPIHNFDFSMDRIDQKSDDIKIGCGYVREIMGKKYIVTCNHILIKNYTECFAYIETDRDHVIRLSLQPVATIYELDLAILSILDAVDVETMRVCDYSSIPQLDSLSTISDEYNGMMIYKTSYLDKKTGYDQSISRINETVTLRHAMINSSVLNDVPVFEFNPLQIEGVDQMITTCKNNHRLIFNIVSKYSKSFSGAIIANESGNLAMIQVFNSDRDYLNIAIRAIPLNIANIICDQMIQNNILKNIGIRIDTDYGTAFDNHGKKWNMRIVNHTTCKFINGKKDFTFIQNDQILKIDNLEFDDHGMIYYELIGIPVTINCYLMLRCLMHRDVQIYYVRNQTFKTVNIRGIPYEYIYTCKATNRGEYIKWNGMIFMELSEEMIAYYGSKYKSFVDYTKNIAKYSTNGESIIVMFNLKSKNHSPNISTLDLIPADDNKKYFFHVLEKIGNKKISNMNNLIETIDKLPKKKQATFTFNNPLNQYHRLNFNV